ncbi:helix-turn-helix DNA binding domain protein [Mycobacterium phage Iwokeuplikedis]|nr:helix-turn-helix DNA binding domain protein [Mycobacterium phage Iwokeuplikedis]
MRKKALKAALKAATRANDELGAANTTLWRQREVYKTQAAQFKEQRDSLNDENVSLHDTLRKALAANRQFEVQQRTQNELFGRALAQVQPETGSSRPNRKKLTKQEVKDIRDAYFGGAKQKDLARNYGVNPATISRTIRGIYH